MTEIRLDEQQKQQYDEESNSRYIPVPNRQKEYHGVHQRGGVTLSNPKLNLQTKHFSNEHQAYLSAFNGESCHSDSIEPRYSSEGISHDNSFYPEPSIYSTANQVNLIDFIGGNQRYKMHDNDI